MKYRTLTALACAMVLSLSAVGIVFAGNGQTEQGYPTGTGCQTAAPDNLPKSTQSHHYQVLREAGLIRSERKGTEVVNTLRCTEIEGKFPGLVPAIMHAANLTFPACPGDKS